MSANPFEVLRLDPSASEEEVVRRAGQLRQRASEDELTAIRQAVQALTGRPEERVLHALLTPPKPTYHWPALERLANAFRRPPAVSATEPLMPPALDLDEFAALLRPLLLKELAPSPLPFEPPAVEEPEEEILRQTIDALWQLLPFEPLA
ncbi:MAG TPA: hypothetical protein VKD72_26960 [Gemmataceae bacterium]|nr:hypothetical protein [Gemmataceae bacterium]